MGDLISLNRARVDGTTIVWRGLRHTLSIRAAFEIAEELGWLLTIPGITDMHGWRLNVTRERVTLTGWDMGPIELTRDEAVEFSLTLARAVAPFAREVLP